MATGIVVRPDPAAANAVDDAVSQASGAFQRGVRQVWLGQRFDVDALTLAAVIANAVPGLGVGTAVVPINPRHPLLVASVAQTAQAAAWGNFSLGIGLGGNALEQRAFGIPGGKEVARLREYLTVLRAVRDDGAVDFQGQQLTARPPLSPAVARTAIPHICRRNGPAGAAGRRGTGRWHPHVSCRPRTIEEFIKPAIAAAAADADRPPPRIIASVPVAITKNPDTARADTAKNLDFYNQFPSYQRIMAREGVAHAADLAVIGNPDTVISQLLRYRAAGATDLVLSPFQTELSALQLLWAVAAEM